MPSTIIEDYDPSDYGMGDGDAWGVVVGRFMPKPDDATKDDASPTDTQQTPEQHPPESDKQ